MKARHLAWGLFFFLMTMAISGEAAPWSADSSWANGNVADYSVNMLSAIFGHVGNALNGGTTLAQTLFHAFNLGVFGVMAIFVGYNVVHHSLGASLLDTMGGQENPKLALAFGRNVAAIALLLPVAYYNGIEVVTMQCVVEGTKFANWIYHQGLDAVYAHNVPFFNRQDSLLLNTNRSNSSAIVKHDDGNAAVNAADNAGQAAVDASLGNYSGAVDDLKHTGKPDSNPLEIFNNPDYTTFADDNSADSTAGYTCDGGPCTKPDQVMAVNLAKTINDPAVPEPSNYTHFTGSTSNTTNLLNTLVQYFKKNKDSSCVVAGSSDVTVTCSAAGTDGKQSETTVVTITPPSDLSLIHAATAASLYISALNAVIPIIQADANLSPQAFDSTPIYNAYLSNLAQNFTTEYAPKASTDQTTLSMPQQRDWTMAGAFILSDLAKTHSNKGGDNSPLKALVFNALDVGPSKPDATPLGAVPDVSGSNTGTGGTSWQATHMDGSIDSNNVTGAIVAAAGPNIAGMIMLGITDGFVSADLSALSGLSNSFNQNGSPIEYLKSLGGSLINNALNAYVTVVSVTAVGAVGACMMSGENPFCQPYVTSVMMILPLITIFMNLSIAAGAMLALYVPLYPMMIFLFCVLSWFMAVVEAMVAGPLIAIGLTHPKGHNEILSKAEQAMMLLLSVFLRPVLIIISLFVACGICYVGIRVAMTGFAVALSTVINEGGDASAGIISTVDSAADNHYPLTHIVTYPALIALMVILIMKVMEQSFSIMSTLPNQILMWIGGPATSDQSLNAMRQVQGQIGSATSKMGDVMPGMLESTNKGVGSLMTKRNEKGQNSLQAMRKHRETATEGKK